MPSPWSPPRAGEVKWVDEVQLEVVEVPRVLEAPGVPRAPRAILGLLERPNRPKNVVFLVANLTTRGIAPRPLMSA